MPSISKIKNVRILMALLLGLLYFAFNNITAYAAAINPSSGNSNITGSDTWNTNAGLGATDANLTYTGGAGARSFTVTNSLGNDTVVNVGTITATDNTQTNALIIGNGSEAVTFTVNGAVSGNAVTDANDLMITVDSDDAAAHVTVIDFKADVDIGNAGNIILNSDADGTAIVNFSGTAAQTVTGTIRGFNDDDGNVIIANSHASGVTFNSALGGGSNSLNTILVGNTSQSSVAIFNSSVDATNGINVGSDTKNGTATFKGNVTGAITLGSSTTDGDTNIAIFDSSSNNVTIANAVGAADAGDNNSLSINGGTNKVIFSTDMGANIDTVIIANNSTLELNSDGDAT